MNKPLFVFTVFSAVAVVVYISLFLQLRKPVFKLLSHAHYSEIRDIIRTDPRLHTVGKHRHNETQHQKNLEQDSTAENEVRNETSLNQTLSSNSVLLRGNVSLKTSSQKYLIYLCHNAMCGGWSDRQRGLVSVYILSLVTDRKFGVIMDNPCNVTHFYVPNDVNWIIPAVELKNKTNIVINDIGGKARIQLALIKGFNEHYPQDVVYIKTNSAKYRISITHVKRYERKLPTWSKIKKNSLVFSKAWKILMKPSPYLQHRLDDYLQSIGYEQRTHPLVCTHVRVGRSDSLKTDGRVRMNVSDITELWKFFDKYVQNGSKVFLATDNLEVRNLTRQRFGGNMSDTGGAIVHVDRWTELGVNDACAGFGYAVLDQLILTKCDVLVLTNSGFGERAANIRGESKNLFHFVRNKLRSIVV